MAINYNEKTFLESMITDNSYVERSDSIDTSLTEVGDNQFECKYFYKNQKLLNEFIGERLAKKLKLETAHYTPCIVNNNVMVKTKNFKKYDYDYMNPDSVLKKHSPVSEMDDLERYVDDKCIDDILKLFALDIYMRQEDRCFVNILFKKNRYDNIISLAPIYDYSESFINTLGAKYNIYFNALFDVVLRKETIKTSFIKYPKFYDYLEKLSKIDLEEIIVGFCDDYDLISPKEVIDYYKKEEEKSKTLIKGIMY